MLDYGFYNMDCMQGMKEFPDKYFDLAIVDPPYGNAGGELRGKDGEHFGGRFDKYRSNDKKTAERRGAGWAKKFGKKIIGWDIAPDSTYFKELFRVSKNQIIWGGNYFELPPTRCFLIWRKTNMPEKFSMAMCEYAWTSFFDNAKMFECSSLAQTGRFHPTQKPVELYKWILNNYANANDVILDTHVGSASSLIACRETGHKYVGFEIDPNYYAKAKERLDAETAQMNLIDFFADSRTQMNVADFIGGHEDDGPD